MTKLHFLVLSLLLFRCSGHQHANKKTVGSLDDIRDDNNVINIGVVVDMGSWLGKVVQSCITMAVKDFYNSHSNYKTRISLQIRDSMGDPLQSVSAAIDLLETLHVHALIVPIISNSELFIANLADKVHVPLLSFSSLPSFDEHPYYLQVAGDETTEFHGIATLSKSFKWKECVILHEDTADARQVQLVLHNILLENNIIVKYRAPISFRATGYQIVDELRKIMKLKTPIIIVDLSPSLMSQVLLNAKILGMMSKGFAWIVTSKTMNVMSIQDSSVHEVMEGVLGFRSYIMSSSKLQHFTSRWRRESNTEIRELSVHGVQAYDAVWAVARAVEKADIKSNAEGFKCNLLDSACLRVSESGQALLTQILRSKFVGLAGVFELKNRILAFEAYEIVNVLGKWERRVGLWTLANGLTMYINTSDNLSSNSIRETIIWPGISLTTPASQSVQINGKILRVLVPSGEVVPELVHWRDERRNDVTAVGGYCVDVFVAAFDWLQYNISFEFFPFHNESYNDLLHQVFLQNYDVAVGDITILANRSAYVDFTCPFTEMGFVMVTKLDDKDPWFFVKPLDPGVWIMSACWFIFMGALVWLIEHKINDEFQGSSAWQVGTAMWFAISTLVFAHREKLKSNLSRFVVGVWLFVVLILTSCYTANLSSLLTVQKFKLSKSDYIGAAYNSLVERHAVSNLNFRDDRVRLFRTVDDYAEPLRRGSKNGGVGAIFEEMPYVKVFLAKYPNEFTIVETSLTTSGFGFAFQKGSPFVAELSRAIDGLREEGKLLEMEKKWFIRQSVPLLSQENQTPLISTLGIHNLSGLFLISAASVVITLVIVLFISLEQRLFEAYIRLRARVLLLLLGKFFPNLSNPNIQNGLVQLARIN